MRSALTKSYIRKSIGLFLTIIGLQVWSFGQSKKQDVVYLNDSSVLRGKIISQSPNGIRLQMGDGSVWAFPQNRITQITQEPIPPLFQYKKRGYAHYTELGPLVAGKTTIDGVTTAAFSFHTINGYRFSRPLFLGLGVGADLYATQTIVPVILSYRGDLSERGAVLPYVFAEGGYGFNLTQNTPTLSGFKGGLTYAAGLGMKIPFNRTTGFLLGIGYHYQFTEFNNQGAQQEVLYKRLTLRAGFFL